MESVYLKEKPGRKKPVSWCSVKVNFKDYFSKFSDQLHDVYPHTKMTTNDIFHRILPEAELSNGSLETLIQLTDPNNFRRKIGIGNISKETSLPSTSRENMSSTSKESNQSTSEGILSASKQQDKAESGDWVEAEIVSNSQEETTNVPARKIGQGPIKNQNIEVKKKQRKRNVKKSDSKGQNNHGHVQHDVAAEKTAPDPDKRSTTEIKTYGRKINVKKSVNRMENNEVQNQCDGTLSASNPNKRSSPEIKTYQKKGSVQREINKKAKDNVTSSEEIVSQLLINLLAEGSVLGSSISKENNQSTLGEEGFPSIAKQQDKAPSRGWVVAEIVSSSDEETPNVPAREIGKGCIKNQNTEAKKKQIIIKSDNKGQNNHVHFQHNAAAEKTAPYPDERSTTEIKTYKRKINVKESVNNVKNSEVQNQHEENLSVPSTIKRPSLEIKTYQKKGNVQRVINKDVNEILSQLLTDVSAKESVTGATKHSNTVVSTYKNKTNLHNFLNGDINEEVQVLGSSISKENNQSTLGEGFPSIAKQQDEAPSRGWVVAEIVSSSDEESTNVPAREIGKGCIKNQNTEAKKKQIIIKSDNKGQNNHVHFQHNAAAEKTAPYPDERSTTEIKTYKRKINVKESVNNVKNSEVQNQHEENLSVPSTIKRPSLEIKTYQKKRNVQRVINKDVNEILSQLLTDVSAKESVTGATKHSNTVVSTYKNKTNLHNFLNGAINEEVQVPQNASQLLIDVSAEESVTGATKHSNTVLSTYKNKTNVHNFLNGAINEEVQVPQNATSSEAFEIVSQLLESLLINLNSDSELSIGNPQTLRPTECFDLQSKTNAEIAVKVDGLSTEESLTNTGNTSLDIATPSTVDHKENMATTPENRDIFKVLPRRSTRRVMKKQIEKVCINKCEEEETKEWQNANNCNDTSEPTEIAGGAERNSEPRYVGDIMSEITKRGGRNKRRNKTVRGQILVDTTKRLGKKDLVPRKHFVVSFRIHKSFHQNMGQKGVRPGKCLQEIDVLNYQTLADLRRKILCEADFQDTAGDVSSWPYTPVTTISKQKYKSGMFYINNTFYVDTREGSEDYSVVIRKWAEEHFIQVGETKPMDEVKVEDLEMRLGYPYVYMHQGSCEHLIIISDARLLTEKKSLHSSDYPNLTKTTRSSVYYCVTCTMKPANWIVIGSDQMIQDTNFMCENCFHSFHYVGTQKVGNFKAYHLRQRAILFH